MLNTIEALSPESEEAWDRYVDAHPDSTCYHCRAWQVAARNSYAIDTPSLMARDEAGAVVGVLPLFAVRRGWSRYGVTAMFGGYGQTLADTPEIRDALLEEARRISNRLGLSHLLHKSVGEETVGSPWGRGDAAVIATLSLVPGESELWKGFRSEIRNRVRKAERSGLQVREGEGEFERFYEVLAANMHRKGTPIYGRAFLRAVLEGFGPRAYVITVGWPEKAVGGALVIHHRGVVNVPFVSSLPSAFPLAPNNLLYWEIIRRSCALGLVELDFGRSFRGTSNLEFKRRWGATVKPQPFYFIHRGAPPIIEPGGRLVQTMVKVWQSIPRALADGMGPALAGRLLV